MTGWTLLLDTTLPSHLSTKPTVDSSILMKYSRNRWQGMWGGSNKVTFVATSWAALIIVVLRLNKPLGHLSGQTFVLWRNYLDKLTVQSRSHDGQYIHELGDTIEGDDCRDGSSTLAPGGPAHNTAALRLLINSGPQTLCSVQEIKKIVWDCFCSLFHHFIIINACLVIFHTLNDCYTKHWDVCTDLRSNYRESTTSTVCPLCYSLNSYLQELIIDSL